MPHFWAFLKSVNRFKSNKRSHSGDNGDEDPPVPIPNTEVKLVYGESSWHRAPARIANCRISIKNGHLLHRCKMWRDSTAFNPAYNRLRYIAHFGKF